MYLSTLFLSKIEYGALQTITLCNDEFLRRFSSIQHDISNFFVLDSQDNFLHTNSNGDELIALWDVCKDFEEIHMINLPVLNVMHKIHTIRDSMRRKLKNG